MGEPRVLGDFAAKAMRLTIAIVLGRIDSPTDAVEDYAGHLRHALTTRGHAVRVTRVPWDTLGWLKAGVAARQELRAMSGAWVLLQYTHLMWSRHGFPLATLVLAPFLLGNGRRLGVVLHDPLGFPGHRLRDRIRRRVQHWVMKVLVRVSDCTFITLEPRKISWNTDAASKDLHFLPIGSNILPSTDLEPSERFESPLTVVVFGVTGGRNEEVDEIARVVGAVGSELGSLHLVLLGRGSSEAGESIRSLLQGSPVAVTVTGVVRSAEASRWLGRADALLFVRGSVSTRRGTVMAAVVHGVPIVGYEGPETDWPITDAGVALAPLGDTEKLAALLVRVARDTDWAQALRERNLVAATQHFAWDRIASQVEAKLVRGRPRA